ncbi:MAG: heme-binding protein [Gammaproteobacteria bacterium]|nr:heme-binding protein [Gammaproteobacteria bacterium]
MSVVGASAQEKRPTLDAETAKAIVEGCEHYAASNDIAVAIAVAGPGELLAALLRMDDVVPGAVEVAIWKARSSAKTPSISTVPGVASVAGGQPIFSLEGKLLGGVGVSGATENQDTACALAGIDAASRKLDEE